MANDKIKIGITVGDINGIGLEVILKTLSDNRLLNWLTPVLYGSTKVASYHKNVADIKDLPLHNCKDIHSLNPKAVNIINCWIENVKISLGKCTEEGGKYATFSLEQSIEDLKNGHIDALVTAPINKKAMQLSGFNFPGHTEYLTQRFDAPQNLMLMVHDDLKIGLVTNHLPISQIGETLNESLILQKIELMNESLKMDFGIEKPAIAVLGLNPHAGDNGVLGNEEIDMIIPAIEKAKRKGILAIGPYAADGFFGSGNYHNFDGILAMYHDQGLAPFKALSFGGGINYTAGLPIIRTSPDHGTGYDIAGKNEANPQSFRKALYLAIDCFKMRRDYLEMTSNPMKEIDLKDYDKKQSKYKSKNRREDRPKKQVNKTTQATNEEVVKEAITDAEEIHAADVNKTNEISPIESIVNNTVEVSPTETVILDKNETSEQQTEMNTTTEDIPTKQEPTENDDDLSN
jgi:4-hydroxythreonine-4-phosphate dehydrogenase